MFEFLRKIPFRSLVLRFPRTATLSDKTNFRYSDTSSASRKLIFKPKYSASRLACGRKYYGRDWIMQISSGLYKIWLYCHTPKCVAPENINAISSCLVGSTARGCLQSRAKPVKWTLPRITVLASKWVTCFFSSCSIHNWSPTSIVQRLNMKSLSSMHMLLRHPHRRTLFLFVLSFKKNQVEH